ncbi:hypothetical protein SAMN05444680_103346 [Variovorax sp. YR216]|nr:hypothetical protein SAMN05444680_103346 [Variovorax sp. YR216]
MPIAKARTILALIALFFVYYSNHVSIWAGDSFGSSVFAANLIQNHTIYFDAVTKHQFWPSDAFFFTPTVTKHTFSSYPLLPMLIYAPFNAIYYFLSPDCVVPVFSAEFESCRLSSDKFSSAILATIAALLFYRIAAFVLRHRCSAFLATIFYALGTNHFITSSQSNWQHGPIELLCLIAIGLTLGVWTKNSSLFKPTLDWVKSFVLFFILGLLIWLRVTNGIWALPFFFWLASHRRQDRFGRLVLAAAVGLCFGMLGYVWNYREFGSFIGGYSTLLSGPLVEVSPRQFYEGAHGLLLSAGRGIFFITPIVVLAFAYWPRATATPESSRFQLLNAWRLSAVGLLIFYCFYRIWWGGWSMGARLLTDSMPILVLCAAVAVEKSRSKYFKLIYLVAGIVGVGNQLCLAFGASGLYGHQYDRLNFSNPEIAYKNWHDPALLRAYLAVYNKAFYPASFWADEIATENSSACILSGAASDLEIEVVNRGSAIWIGFQGGSSSPPQLSLLVNGRSEIFFLKNRFVGPGQNGKFVNFKNLPRGTSTVEQLSWGNRALSLRC